MFYDNGFMSIVPSGEIQHSHPKVIIKSRSEVVDLIKMYGLEINLLYSSTSFVDSADGLYFYATPTDTNKFQLIPTDADDGYTVVYKRGSTTVYTWLPSLFSENVVDISQGAARDYSKGPCRIQLSNITNLPISFGFRILNQYIGSHTSKSTVIELLPQDNPETYIEALIMINKWYSLKGQ